MAFGIGRKLKKKLGWRQRGAEREQMVQQAEQQAQRRWDFSSEQMALQEQARNNSKFLANLTASLESQQQDTGPVGSTAVRDYTGVSTKGYSQGVTLSRNLQAGQTPVEVGSIDAGWRIPERIKEQGNLSAEEYKRRLDEWNQKYGEWEHKHYR